MDFVILSNSVSLFILLMAWHFIADYPLQGEFLAKAKAKAFEPVVPWWQAMTAHAFIHAAGVFLLTQNVFMFLFEFIAHFMIDKLKCDGKINFNQDQIAHVMCKVVYIIWILLF